jgi:CII-binding regulator of phage lambda lysogenization HflD
MSDGANSEPALPSAATTEGGDSEDQLGLSGENILTLLQRSAGLAEGNSRYAVEIAQNLSHQLEAAKGRLAELESRVAELEAAVEFYRDKSERAEEWLGKISSELQERVTGKPN